MNTRKITMSLNDTDIEWLKAMAVVESVSAVYSNKNRTINKLSHDDIT